MTKIRKNILRACKFKNSTKANTYKTGYVERDIGEEPAVDYKGENCQERLLSSFKVRA